MKNRIFQSVVAVVMVVAMTFMFVGCGGEDYSTATVAPSTAVTAQPTSAPSVDTESTTTPSVSVDKVETSDSFCLAVKAYDGEYGTALEYDDEEISSGYFQITWDTESAEEQHYSLDFEIEIESDNADYEIAIYIPAGNSADSISVSSTDFETSDVVAENGSVIIKLNNAGEYALSCEVVVKDCADDFGAWNTDPDEKDEFEFSLYSSLEIAKQQITIEISPAVIVESEYSLSVDVANSEFAEYQIDGTTEGERTVYFPASYEFDGYSIGLAYSIDYTEEGKIGTYAVAILEEYTYGENTYEDLEDLNELFDNHEIVAVKDTAVYVISAYDYAEIGDVITSISEIYYDETDGFFGADGNIAVQLPLAVARYNNLTVAQKAYFDTPCYVEFSTYTKTNVNKYLDAESTDSINALAFYEYMQEVQEEYEEYTILHDFYDFVSDSKLLDYTFNTANSTVVGYYNSVNEYFNSLDSDSQDIIEADNSEEYQGYKNAYDAILQEEVANVEELIVGAYQGYLKATTTNKIIYQDSVEGDIVSSWAYIESSEVEYLVSQAKTAFDNLSQEGKDLLIDSADGEDMISDGTYVAFVEDQNTVYNALTKLVEMGEMVETMIIISQYVNIDDYSTSDVAYSRLNALVYGVEYSDGENTVVGGMYFPTYSGDDDAMDYRYAMQDIISAPSRNYDAIIAEYKEWLLYIEDIESYKTTVMIEFMSQVSSAVSALDKDDYEASVLSSAKSTNTVYGLILASVMAESIVSDKYIIDYETWEITFYVSGDSEPDTFQSVDILGGNSGVDIVAFIDANGNFLDGKDDFDDIYEAYEEFIDTDDLLDSYIDAIREKE